MKLLAAILSFYILLLSCYPCQDAHGHHDDDAGIVLNDLPSDCSDQEDGHHCSPLCACGCCTVPCISTTYAFLLPELHPFPAEPTTSLYKPPFIPSLIRKIWHPEG